MLTHLPIDVSQFLAAPIDPACGALATFFGVVRDTSEGKRVKKLFYDTYEELAKREMERIRQDLLKRYSVRSIYVCHRVGFLEVGEIAVAIAVHAAHRAEAFAACREMIDQIKATVPIWKHEFYEDGTEAWTLCHHAHSVERAVKR